MPLNDSARGNISKILLDRSSKTPEHKAFVFLDEQGAEDSLSYREIHTCASTVASAVGSIAEPGARVILLCPTSSEFIAAFFGCLYAGIVPVPASPPSRRTHHRLVSMISNCDPSFVITTRKFSETFDGKLQSGGNSKNPETIFLDDLPKVEDFQPTDASSDQLAFLQYTSGSTDLPKGVMVTHGNLWHNLNRIRSCFDAQEGSMSVSWLPLFHDMGLIGQMIGAVYTGVGSVLMQPSSFLRAPLSWVEVISKYRAFCAGGPNFAYDLCVQAASERQPQDLDLSHWKVAFSGAEPVRAGTLKRFAECFAPYGFHSDAFLPVYGLAESTLLVASGKRASRVKTMHLDPQELENNRAITVDPQRSDARQIICCGTPDESERIEIVDPDKLCRVAEGCIGEIWVSSPSIAAGYWGNPQASQETFMARLSTDPSRLYCRTGDLGYIHQGSLYITGRLKDLIIIRGRNHYPNDIESTTAMCHTAIEASGVAAIGVTVDEEEKLVVLAEIGRSSRGTVDLDEVSAAIRKAVYESHSLSIHEICLLQLGQLPRTTSGKIQRHACRISYLDKSLKPANSKLKTPSTQPLAQVPSTGQSVSRQKADGIINWLRDYSQERINSRLIDERRCIPPYIVLDFGNRGLLGMVTTEEFGGQGMLISDSMRVIEQLAAIDLTLASFVGIQHALGIHPIEHHAQPQVRQRWLPELARGRQLAAFAITEPQAGSNPNALVSKALPDGENRWRIHGQKSWIGTAAWAGVINVFARQYDSAGNHIGVSGFVVPQESKGLRMGPEALTMGVRGMVQNSVFFRGVSVHAMDLLGEQGRGMQVAHEAMMLGRLGICAMSVGAMKRCAQLMMRYAQRRSIATGRLVDNPLTQQRLSELTLCISVVDNLTHAVGRSLDDHKTIPAEAFAVCKIAGPECLATATDQLMQMLGGRGYIETNMVPQMLRDARLLRIFEGPSETLLAFLGSQAIVGSQGLFGFIKEALQAPQVATALHDALLKIQQQTPSDGTNRYNLAFCAGRLVTQATLWAAACWGLQSRPEQQPQNAVPWAKSRFDQTLWEILRQDHFVFATPELFSNIQSYQSSIGQVDQAMAGEDSQIDPWIAAANQTIDESSNAQVDNQPTPLQATPSEITLEAPVVPTHIDSKSIEEWIIGWLIEKLKVDPKTIRPNQPITQFGLDSVIAVKLILDLEKKFQRQVSIEQFWETPTIESLARWVCGSAPKTATTTKTQPQSDPIPASSGVSASVALTEPVMQTAEGMELSVFFFSSPDPSERTDKYQLVLEASKFADENGFKAVWVPERHFHPFGGLYPNPSTLAAAIAMITKRIRIRSGSVVLPLHDPIRVAEEWSLVDNLSRGRVDLSFTKGWNPDDFVFYPDRFETRQQWLENNLDHVRRLWRGETIQRVNGLGKSWIQGIYPRPVQEELPVWLTCNTSPEGFQWAGANGINLLTALLGQSLEELAEKIDLYRRAREQAGHDPEAGHVTLMLHTFVGTTNEQVRQTVREPLRGYLQDSLHLWAKNVKPLKELSEKEKNKSLDYAFERYYRSSALMGDPDTCLKMIEQVKKAGVNEIACLIDFGVRSQAVLESLKLVGSMIGRGSIAAQSTARQATRRISQQRCRLALQQQSLWVNYKLDPKSAAYNQALAFRVEGPIDMHRAQRAFQQAIAKESILTSSFYEDEQGVWRKSSLDIFPQQIVENLSAEQSVESWLDQRIQEPFDLYSGPPIRVHWLRLTPDDHVLLIVNHHIVADARSMGVFARNGFDIYQQDSGDPTQNDSSPTDATYEEFVEQQHTWLGSPQANQQIEYWQTKLSGTLPLLELPVDRAPQAPRTNTGYTTSGTLGKETTRRIAIIAKECETSIPRLLLAVYSLWLHRITGQGTLVTGLASHGLPDPSYSKVVGHFVNPLPIRSDYDANLKFKEWVNITDETVSEAFHASRCTFANIVEVLRPERVPGQSPIFQTLFNFLGGDIAATKSDSYRSGNLLLKPIHLRQQEGQFDLSVEFIEKADDLIFDLKVASDVFDPSTAERFRASFLALVDHALSEPDSAISQLELVAQNDLMQLGRWNSNECELSEHRLAFELFQEQVAFTPGSIAVSFGDQSMQYIDLNIATNQLAYHLRSLGARPDAPIGIYMNRSVDLVIAVLAIMKSGSAFLPLNVDEPWVRTQTILEDARPILVITQECFQDRWNAHPARTVLFDRDQEIIKRVPNSDLEPLSRPSDLAYIMYTSGSTGRPKGVQVEHRNLINFLESMRREPGISSSDIVLAVTPLTFDISILELLLPLCVGAQIVIASRTQATDAHLLAKLLSESKATWMQATPSHWGMLLESDWQPTGELIALCGGEAMSRDLADKLLARCKAVWNMYGPTETTIWSSIYRVRQSDSNIPIGHPILNTELLVLDQHMRTCPIGTPGELYIAGAGVARGYLNRPELTSEKFVDHPSKPQFGVKAYRSGDKARWSPQGVLEYLGRSDNQVKIRGHRIEPGEIETVLRSHPMVKEAVVIPQEDSSNNKRLVAHVSLHSKSIENLTRELRRFVSASLPDFMVPSAFVTHATIPLTPHGKIDLKSLQQISPTSIASETAFEGPRNKLERQLCTIWAEVLGVRNVGIHDNYFELGGDSLLAVKLILRLSKALDMEITVADLFHGQTVAQMAQSLSKPSRVNWTDEMTLPTDFRVLSRRSDRSQGKRRVLLTGATGFIGSHILRDILEQTQDHVFCLVHEKDTKTALDRLDACFENYQFKSLVDRKRVQIVRGNLSKVALGLDLPTWNELSSQIDLIVHAGAWVNFAFPYQALRPVNVQGTIELLRFLCQGNHKSMVFVSSLTALDDSKTFAQNPPTELDGPGKPENLATGYAQTKAVSERLLEQAAKLGLSITRLRVGLISGASASGTWSNDQWLPQALRASALIRQFPLEFADKTLRLMPVDYASKAIVQLLGETIKRPEVIHLDGKPIGFDEIIDRLPGGRPELVSFSDWLQMLKRSAEQFEPGVIDGLLAILSNPNEFISPILPDISTAKSRAFLESIGVKELTLDPRLIERYWNYLLGNNTNLRTSH